MLRKNLLHFIVLVLLTVVALSCFIACDYISNDVDDSILNNHIHSFSNWITTSTPSCTAQGMQTRTCTDCGFAEYTQIPMLGHTEIVDNAIAATCVEDGKTAGSHCGICNAIIVEQTIIKSTGHNYVNGECSVCHEFDEDSCFETYQKLREEMMTATNFNSFTTIEEYLSALPNNYRDVDVIKNDLIFIKSQCSVFSDAIFQTMMKSLSEPTDEDYKEYYIDYSKVRRAYFNLINNQKQYPNWNLENIANNYAATGDSFVPFLLFLIVGSWEDTNGNYFDVIENEDNSLSFRSNLPNQKSSSKTYYYYIDGRIIGHSTQDEEDKFSAYRITEIGEDYIKVFCFKNSLTYTLNRS